MRLIAVLATFLATPALADPPRVVADTPVVHSLVTQVMAGAGAPQLLLDRGADPHNFQLRPSQARGLAEADLVFWVGPELTPWLARALEGVGAEDRAFDLLHAKDVRHRSFGDDHAHEMHGHEDHGDEHHGHDDHGHDDHGHAHDGLDPHAWLDPANASAWVAAIEARLIEADPENADLYAANGRAARAEILALDAELRATLAPAAGRPIYVFHDAYGYLADAYGLTVAGTLAMGDAAAPGAARLAAIRAELADHGAACIFAEANHDPGLIEAVAEGTGIDTGLLDPSGALIEPGPGHYAATLRALAAEIARCVEGG